MRKTSERKNIMKAVLDEAAVQDVIRFLCEGIPLTAW